MDKLNGKVKSYKKQAEEAAEQAQNAISRFRWKLKISKFRTVQLSGAKNSFFLPNEANRAKPLGPACIKSQEAKMNGKKLQLAILNPEIVLNL